MVGSPTTDQDVSQRAKARLIQVSLSLPEASQAQGIAGLNDL